MKRRISGAAGATLLAAFWMLLGFPFPFHGGPDAASAQALIINGNFEASATSGGLRAKKDGWYESRHDGKAGRRLLVLSKKPVAGDATKKAMIKASAKRNTYLSQEFKPQTGRVTLKWDILVKKILPGPNRGAFQMIGTSSGKAGRPNATGSDRFVFLAFQNSKDAPGKIDLIAYEGGGPKPMAQAKTIAAGLDKNKWYTVTVNADVAARTYTVSVSGATPQPVLIKAYDSGKGSSPKALTAVSFASWNDGPATFYVDNVGQ
jgi:hypothetical protein